MPRTRPQRGASIIQASPSPTSPHIPLSIPARRRGIRGTHQTLPPSKKQSQDISYLHEQARLECTPTPRCKHCPRKPIRASTRHPLSLPAQRSDVALRRNPPTKHKAIARHLVSSRTSPLGVHAHTEVQALSAQAHPSINSTPALTPCPMDKPIVMAKPLHQARSNRKTSPLGVHAHTEVQALSKQNPSKNVNLTSRSHSLPDVGARHSIDFDQTLPPSKKQLQDISYLHEQTRLECTPTPRCKHCPRKPIQASTRHPLSLPAQRSDVALRRNPSTEHKAIARHLVSSRTSPLGVHAHTEVQALSKHAHPALTPCPTVGCGTPAEPFVHQARSNRKLSRLLTNKPAWSARPHRGASIVRASPSEHQLDTHSHSPPAAGGGTPPAPTPQAYVPMMGAMCLKGRRRGIGVPPRPAHAGRSPPYIVHSGFFGSGRLAYEKAEMSHHAINFDCVIIMTGT
ncbi:uncharacterized protein LOC127147406 isoform X27 [Cucumis melo]|uniref:Uncharacterized protein LOC127147406 isoform X26 n=1 Tax=Cucumis melo TaxID=3656 RepID=A0ABM3KGB0_CUCME|nr:uncharacterized protein LOC127147406 isoform X26 [Cucumis melo]XP_050936816.1 uncharacterized protein LOC127147406 isoform X27 [Cucumis melo]